MPVDLSKAKELFLAVLEMSAAERSGYLDTACAGDTALRHRVEAMLKTHENSGELLPRSPGEMLAEENGTEAEMTAALQQNADPNPTHAESANGTPDDLPFLTPSANPTNLGRLGHYEVQEVIGKGGFGIVLKGFDERLHRVVAIKVLSPAYAANGSARKRFIREAQAVAAVKNEHVVGIYDVQEDANPPFLVMECIEGLSLQEKIDKEGTLGVTEILRIGMQIAEGLAAAHKQGKVHRDIKPSNILLENGVERVKITDFGLARAVDDASVTQSGTVAGTPMYMSPEQAEGVPIDHRSDLFSLGTVMYAMCTGHPPFRASGTHAVMKRVIDASPRPIREINNEIPDWLCDIIRKLHAKKPEDRFQKANEVAELLGQHLAHLQQPNVTPAPPAVSLTAAEPKQQWRVGDQVLAPLVPEWHYLCKVLEVKEDSVLVTFENAYTAWVAASDVRPDDIGKNTRVLGWAGWWSGHHPGTVTERDGDRVLIQYDNGGAKWTKLNKIVVPTDKAANPGTVVPTEPFNTQALVDSQPVASPYIHHSTRRGMKLVVLCGSLGAGLGLAVGLFQPTLMPSAGREVSRDIVSTCLLIGSFLGAILGVIVSTRLLMAEIQQRVGMPLPVAAPRRDRWRLALVPLVSLLVFAAFIAGSYVFSDSARLYMLDMGELRVDDFHPEFANFVVTGDTSPEFVQGFPLPSHVPLKLEPGTYRIKAVGSKQELVERWDVKTSGMFFGSETQQSSEICTLEIKRGERISLSIAKWAPVKAVDAPSDGPWVQLFNGKNLDGWKTHPTQPGDWKVEQGSLVGRGGGTHLFTERGDFENFHFRVEAKMNEGGDSGQLFRCEYGASAPDKTTLGYEANIAFGGKFSTGSLWGADWPPLGPKESVGAPDTWLTQEVIARGNHIIIKVNGKITVDFVDPRARYRRGHLAVQAWALGTVVQFKKIEIKELPPEEPGWSLLFNGKDLDGWVPYAAEKPGVIWHVADETLIFKKAVPPASYLRTAKAYRHYELQLEFKFPAETSKKPIEQVGSLRFMSLRPDGKPGFPPPYVLQVELFNHLRGALAVTQTPKAAYFPDLVWAAAVPGEWNRMWIRCEEELWELTINDRSVGKVRRNPKEPAFIGLTALNIETHLRNIKIKEPPPEEPKLPESAEQVLPALAGRWKGEYTQKIYGGKPDVKKFNAVAVNDWIVGNKWLRQRVQIGDEGFQSVTTFEPGVNAFRDFFFHSRGLIFGPSTARWESATRTLIWTNLPDAKTILLMTFRFVDANTFTGEILIRDKDGNTVFEMSSLMKRTTENIAIDENIAAGPLPKEMAVLDRLVGDWQTTGTIKNAKNPDGLKATWQSSVRRILGGRVIATERTGYPGDDESYSLATFDTFSKAYGRWSFRADGSVMEYGGLWDEDNQTLKWHWAGKDGSQSSNTWPLRDPNRRDWQVLTKDALGKTTFQVEATSVRKSEPGWVKLFNGKDLDGWNYRHPNWLPVNERLKWSYDQNVMTLAGKERGIKYVCTDRNDFENFELRGDIRLDKSVKASVYFHVTPDAPAWKGMAINISSSMKPGLVSLDSTEITTTFGKKEVTLTDGAWHRVELSVRGNRVIAKLDGVAVLDHELAEAVAAMHNARGRLALRVPSLGAAVSFRNFEIKELPAAK